MSAGSPMNPTSRPRLLLLALCLTQMMLVIDFAAVTIGLPVIRNSLALDIDTAQWLTTAYVVTFAGLLLMGGRLADDKGPRRMLLWGVAIFTLAAGLCLAANSIWLLLAGRALEGAGAALATPAGLAVLTTAIPDGVARARAVGLWSAMAGLGGATGLIAGSMLAATLGWRGIFLPDVVIGATVFAMIVAWVPDTRPPTRHRRLAPAGALALTGALALAVLTVTRARFTAPVSIGSALPALIGLALIAVVLVTEARSPAPILPPGLVGRARIRAGVIVGLAIGASGASCFFVAQYLQDAWGQDPVSAAALYLPMPLSIAAGAALSRRLTRRIGLHVTLTSGLILVAAGMALVARLPATGSYLVDLAPGLVLVGTGRGIASASNVTRSLSGLDTHQAGITAGIVTTADQIGIALGISGLASLAGTGTGSRATLNAGCRTAVLGGLAIAIAGIAASSIPSLIASRTAWVRIPSA
jgi:MFS family permease